MSDLAKVKKEQIDEPSQEEDKDVTFSVFGTDEDEEFNLGLGGNVTSAQVNNSDNNDKEIMQEKPKEKRKTNRETIVDKSNAITQEELEELEHLNQFHSDDIEDVKLAILRDKIKHHEKKKKLGEMYADNKEELDNAFSSLTKSIESVKVEEQGSLTIVDDEEADDNQYEGDLSDLATKFEEEQKKKNTIIKEKVVEKDKKTFSDRVGIAIKWLLNTFIVAPVKGLFKALYAGVFNIFGFLGSILKFLLVSIVVTAIFLVLYTNFVNPELSAKEIALQNFEIVKEVIVKISLDVWGVIKNMFNK